LPKLMHMNEGDRQQTHGSVHPCALSWQQQAVLLLSLPRSCLLS
jgi:hypothetical protein